MIRWYYRVARLGIILFFKITTRVTIQGIENVPDTGPVLIVANHISNADPPLTSVLFKRNALFMAKDSLFKNPVLGYFLYGLGAFPVNRGQIDRKALRHAENVLVRGDILVMFPEATRSKDAKLQEGFPGSALIATRHDVPIVPVGVTGTENLTHWKPFSRRCPVTVQFGKPFHLPKLEGKRKRVIHVEATRIIMEQIANILPEKYRGVYSKRSEQNESQG